VPSLKLILVIAAVSAVTYVGIEHYKQRKGA
jgi:hypothetical protein